MVKGVLALLCESSYSKNDGYTSPNHKLTAKIESIFEDASGRIIISSYAQNAFRTQEIAQLAKNIIVRFVSMEETNMIIPIL